METNSTLTYISESRKFRFEDGTFTLLGERESVDGVMTTLRNGQVLSDGKIPCGMFFVRFTDGHAKITIQDVADSNYDAVLESVRNLIEALKD